MIPRIIHQTWKDERVPERFRDAQRSWQELHPAWDYRFWTDRDLEALVRTRAPELLPTYERYPDAIQRVDAARYVILREFGGMYVDLDTVCLRPHDDLLEAEAVLPRTTPLGLSNQLMLARPGHGLFREAVEGLPLAFERWQRRWLPRHFRILLTTGPLFITGRYGEHAGQDAVRILSLEEHGHGDPGRSYIRHLRGNTWAGWDTRALNLVHDNWKWLAAGVGATVAGLTLFG
jgi:mannosyltransferase OCH1-like enzyme